MVKLLFWLPGEMAKQFRSKSAEVMIRYLGGDISLISEIKAIDQEHNINPNNVARVFRDQVNATISTNLLFNQDQVNHSNGLVDRFGDKTDVFYMFIFEYLENLYSKFGIVGELREFHKRVSEHQQEFGDICFNTVLQCSNVYKVESEFKETSLYRMNKCKIPKKSGGHHTEIIKLSGIVTASSVSSEMFKIAGDRVLDPPPVYTRVNTDSITLEIEKEKTFQEQEKTKQIQAQEKTKQLQLELELKKLELEMNNPHILRENLPKKDKFGSISKEDILVTQFMDIFTKHSDNPKDYISIDDLYSDFDRWNTSVGAPISRMKFGSMLQKHPDFTVTRVNKNIKSENSKRYLRIVGVINILLK